MCNPVSIGMFALSAGSSLASYGSQKQAARARNRARIRNHKYATEAYYRDILLANADWKNSRTQTEIAIDDIFRQTADNWAKQDQTIAAIWDKEAFNQIDLLKKMWSEDSAREQTGVTAARIAAEPIRKYGHEITKSYQSAIQKVDEAILQKELWENDANSRRRAQWEETWRSPVPGFAPEPEPLESMPGIGGTLLNIALAGVTSYVGGTALNKMNVGQGFNLTSEQLTQSFKNPMFDLGIVDKSLIANTTAYPGAFSATAGASQLGADIPFGGLPGLNIGTPYVSTWNPPSNFWTLQAPKTPWYLKPIKLFN